jgi:hypothetical protein
MHFSIIGHRILKLNLTLIFQLTIQVHSTRWCAYNLLYLQDFGILSRLTRLNLHVQYYADQHSTLYSQVLQFNWVVENVATMKYTPPYLVYIWYNFCQYINIKIQLLFNWNIFSIFALWKKKMADLFTYQIVEFCTLRFLSI